ncbi:hypothetical protein [uncultured Prevotella sp.]|uniref:nSTAND1 domain-containing NTPase n=1 Tax=uncultured Prevotella sp. TaxID=159272 RepID=UPI0027E2BBC6|nr:hypothetical protein [uncultured Prevotella sp.]
MENKYMGILPYNEGEKNIFVGREDETKQLYDRIIRNDYTVYYAASGEGKSSLIKAGLLPILRRRHYFPIYIVFNENEFSQQEDGVIGNIVHKHIESEIAKYNEGVEKDSNKVELRHSAWYEEKIQNVGVVDFLEKNDWWKIRDLRIVQHTSEDEHIELTPLFIFDQFEEVFTKTSVNWTNKFFEWLEFVSIDGVPMELYDELGKCQLDEEIPARKKFKALFSFRTEYLGELDYWCTQKHFLPALLNNRLCLKQMTIAGAREVIKLNSDLTQYTDDIIIGCADDKAEVCKKEGGNGFTQSDDCACVHALILSVICRTISDYKEEECNYILEKLCKNPKDTVNEILLNFYKEKLKNAGLDFVKDEKVITKIENALIDENGKRKRLNSNDPQLDKELNKWIEKLSSDKYGFIKIVGKNKADQTQTVELPHDRLCKAIDIERKNRQKRIRERLNRQEEWMQFGIISFVMLIIAYCLNTLLRTAAPAIGALFVSHEWKNYWGWLSGTKNDTYHNISFDEPFCVLSFLILSFVFIPFIVSRRFNERKFSKPSVVLIVLSSITTMAMGFVAYKSYYLSFTDGIIKSIIVITFVLSLLFTAIIVANRYINRKKSNGLIEKTATLWPLLLGYFMFGLYGFHELLFNTVVGLNEPCDSGWLVSVLVVLLIFGTLRFFKMSLNNVKLKLLNYIIVILPLLVLLVLSFIPHSDKQPYGMLVSIVMLAITTCAIIFMAIFANCRGKARKDAIINKISFSFINICSLLILWYFSLGYNPIAISSDKIVHVCSWRTVVVHDKKTNKYGVLTADGECIIPYVKSETSDRDLSKFPFKDSYFSITNQTKLLDTANADNSFVVKNGILTGKILIAPTIEEYLVRTKKKGLPPSICTLNDSIAYYAALTFSEIRQQNILYLMTGKPYDEHCITSLAVLDSLQAISLFRQIKWLKDSTKIDNKIMRCNADILVDDAMSSIYRELSKSMLLYIIRDELAVKRIPNVFMLHTQMAAAYFNQVPGVNYILNAHINSDSKSTFDINDEYKVYSSDLVKNKLFAWYELFCQLCDNDIGYHLEVQYTADLTPKVEERIKKIKNISNSIKKINSNSTSLESAVKIFVENWNALDSLRNDLNYGKSSDYFDYAEESLSFLRIHEAFKVLSMILCQNRGVYNNAIENAYLKFIDVGFVHKYDVRQDINTLDLYMRKKRQYSNFDKIHEIMNDSITINDILEANSQIRK